MKKCGFYDDEEKDMIAAYESGEFKPVTTIRHLIFHAPATG